jgi:hypothetical protein
MNGNHKLSIKNHKFSMPAVAAIPPTARTAGRFRHAGNGFTAALGKEAREFALDVLPAADRAWDGLIGLAHRAEGFKLFFAFLTDIFVNGHTHLDL